MVVFQNYSLLPWRTVREKPLAVNSVMKDLPAGERKGIVEHHIDMVGLRHAGQATSSVVGWDETTGSDRPCPAIRPKLLLLDEPLPWML